MAEARGRVAVKDPAVANDVDGHVITQGVKYAGSASTRLTTSTTSESTCSGATFLIDSGLKPDAKQVYARNISEACPQLSSGHVTSR